jgi:hypothetical protein
MPFHKVYPLLAPKLGRLGGKCVTLVSVIERELTISGHRLSGMLSFPRATTVPAFTETVGSTTHSFSIGTKM